MARTAKEFDRSQFETLCSMMCTEQEICAFFKTTDKTLCRWVKRTYKIDFSEAYKNFSANGKISLRRLQYKKAQEGNTAMLIWLGKQWLGQTDKIEQTSFDATKINELNHEIINNVVENRNINDFE